MKIGEVAERSGVPAKTIRFWEDHRLLPAPARTPAGYRDYEPPILERLAFIRHAQAAGLTLEHIRQVLDIRDDGQRRQLVAGAAQDPADCRGYCSVFDG